MKWRMTLIAAACLAAMTSMASADCMKQTVDAQGKALPDKSDALKSAIRNWKKRVAAVDPSYSDYTKAQNWTENGKMNGNDYVFDVAGIPCQ